VNKEVNVFLNNKQMTANPFIKAKAKAQIRNEFTAYEVMWTCNKGHNNFQTILDNGVQNDICLKCGKHYQYELKQ